MSRIEDLFLGNTTDTSSVDFFDNAFTFSNHSSNVTCCHPDNTFEVAIMCSLNTSINLN